MIKLLVQRFAELEQQLKAVELTKKHHRNEMGMEFDLVDEGAFLSWSVKAHSLLVSSCGADSTHVLAFAKAEVPAVYASNHDVLIRVRAVFLAAKEDFEGGYLASVKGLVRAEVFDSELEQASELLAAGYFSAAAVVAGVVLETTLRNMCAERGIPAGKLDKINADLVKDGAYSVLVQKQVTALAGIRNSAAHGKVGEFAAADVGNMISEVRRFVSDRVG